MEPKKQGENLDKLNKELYRKGGEFTYGRQKLKRKEIEKKTDWNENEDRKKSRFFIDSPLLLKIFFVSLIFFVLASGVAFYRLFIEPARWSPEAINISVKGQASISGGEDFSFQIIVENNNDVTLDAADIKVLYPEGAFLPGQITNEQHREIRSLGVILPGQTITKNVEAVLFGEENIEKEFEISLEYRVEGSSGTFLKKKNYKVLLATSPVSIAVDVPEEINVGEDIKINVDITSNASDVLKDSILRIDYPFGFSFSESSPDPSVGSNVWLLGDLKASGSRRIEIIGTIEGLPSDEKAFKINVGSRSLANPNNIEIVYNSIIKSVPIKQPFVGINFSINRDSTSNIVVVPSGKSVNVAINWNNNLNSRILNGEIRVRLIGKVFDKNRIKVNGGFYRSIDDTLIWNQTTDRSLAVLEPGQSGSGSFSFTVFNLFGQQYGNIINPEVSIELEYTGERVSPGFENEKIRLTAEKIIKVATEIQAVSYGLYSGGQFSNFGPYPPKVNAETTFNIVWSLANSTSDVRDARMTANLPIYVRWLGKVSSEEDVSFNDVSGLVVWEIGDIPAGAGIKSPARELEFQVGVTPSVSQLGSAPQILTSSKFFGVDAFTGNTINVSTDSIVTKLPNDPDKTISESKGGVEL